MTRVNLYLVPGAVVAGRFQLERLLGEGGMGVVWAANHLETGAPVALKLLRPGAADDEAVRRRFLREARAAAAVHHPNVLEIQEALELDDGTPVLVMDLLQGESLRERLVRDGRIPLPELTRILLPVISAVGTAHARGIVHRDLKPDNIFLVAGDDGDDGGRVRVKVLDFGIAKLIAAEGEAAKTAGATDTGALLGTPYYMSPEQILGEHDVDHLTDVWSLGVILYECLAAVRPTEADSIGKVLKRILTGPIRPIGEIAPEVPAEVAAMIDRMLSPDRRKRPFDLREVGAQLGRVASVGFLAFGPPAAPAPMDSRASFPSSGGRASQASIARITGADHGTEMLATLASGSSPVPDLAAALARSAAASDPAVRDAGAAHATLAIPASERPAPRGRWRTAALLGLLLAVAGVAALLLMRCL